MVNNDEGKLGKTNDNHRLSSALSDDNRNTHSPLKIPGSSAPPITPSASVFNI